MHIRGLNMIYDENEIQQIMQERGIDQRKKEANG